MVREIEFRGTLLEDSESFKTYKKGTVIYGGYFREDDNHYIVAHRIFFKVRPETVAQFTGFYDKNIVKIFENAYVKMPEKFRTEIQKVIMNSYGVAVFDSTGVSLFHLKGMDGLVDVEVFKDDLNRK